MTELMTEEFDDVASSILQQMAFLWLMTALRLTSTIMTNIIVEL